MNLFQTSPLEYSEAGVQSVRVSEVASQTDNNENARKTNLSREELEKVRLLSVPIVCL